MGHASRPALPEEMVRPGRFGRLTQVGRSGRLRIQQAPQETELHVVTPAQAGVSYWSLLKNGTFLRFFLAQFVSSLGDWIGVIAIAVFAQNNFGTTAVGAVMTARVLPGFFVGPLAGVLADRWDRKRTMILADAIRAGIVFSLPFVPNLLYFLFASAVLESLSLAWGPAKDASLPHLVERRQLTHANSLSLIAIYGPWPLASAVFISLSGLGEWLGSNVDVLQGLSGDSEALALWVDSCTFVFSAVMISTLAIPSLPTTRGRLDFSHVKRDLFEGLAFVARHKQVRPWLLGIAFTFTAVGGVFSLGLEFVRSIFGAGNNGFGALIGFLATGMIIGLIASGLLVKRVKKDVLFSTTILLLGIGLITLASLSSLNAALPVATALGFFGGIGYATGYALMQETTDDEMRGRTFSAAYTLIRLGTLLGLGVFPLIAGAIGLRIIDLPGSNTLALPGSRVTFWMAGLVVIGGGFLSMRAIKERRSAGLALTPETPGYFVAFEGGEGAGKTTQMEALGRWLEARGDSVVVTREPGGTGIGERIRAILLDPNLSEMDARTEALLYAADRAQHVAEVIKPALEAGRTVISDRFIDSSLAYQGIARGLGLEDIYEISTWATEGLMPDVVFYMDIDSAAGLDRLSRDPDRMESEAMSFHERVGEAYAELAERFSDRFVVLDGARSQSDIHADVVAALQEHAGTRIGGILAAHDLPTPSAPVPR